MSSGESGGIENAYSDLIGEIAEYFYYGSNDWRVGANSFRGDSAVRYMDDPTIDGVSIENYKNYTKNMNIYYSSGIYSKAIYLLNTMYSWSMTDIFKIFSRANQLYWTSDITFNDGVCALYESLKDYYGTNSTKLLSMTSGLKSAFSTVGLQCNNLNQSVVKCGDNDNVYCIYKDIIPSISQETSFPISMAFSSEERYGVGINISAYFTVRGDNECISPQISFEYENIDLDHDYEWIDVFDYDGNIIERCGNQHQCNTWNTTCIHDKKLGILKIEPDTTYKIFISIPGTVNAFCWNHNYVINAKLIFECKLDTPSPTLPNPTLSPNTYSPTIPTIEPTEVTMNPTSFPTHVITDCSTNDTTSSGYQYTVRYCYHQDVYADIDNETQTIVKIQNIDENQNVYYDINFTILNSDCIEPAITFIYETVMLFIIIYKYNTNIFVCI